MSKAKVIITSLIAVIAIVALSVAAYIYFNPREEKQPTTAYTLKDDDINKTAHFLEYELFNTGYDNFFYSLSPLKYYKISGGNVSEVSPERIVNITVSLQSDKLKFKIPIISINKKTFGVCEYTREKNEIYKKAFAYLTDMPSGSNYSSDSHYLLCLDVSEDNQPVSQRKFSENFAVTKSGAVKGYITSERNRMVQFDGKLRTDQNVLTQKLIDSSKRGVIPVMSGFNYGFDDEDKIWDFRIIKGSYTSTVTKKITGCWGEVSKSGYIYARQNKDSFKVIEKSKSGKDSLICAYNGNLSLDYIRNGDYIINKNTAEIFKLKNGESIYVSKNRFEEIFAFSANDNYLLIGGKVRANGTDKSFYGITLADIKSGKEYTVLGKNLFDRKNSVFHISTDGTAVYTTDGKTTIITSKQFKELSEQE